MASRQGQRLPKKLHLVRENETMLSRRVLHTVAAIAVSTPPPQRVCMTLARHHGATATVMNEVPHHLQRTNI